MFTKRSKSYGLLAILSLAVVLINYLTNNSIVFLGKVHAAPANSSQVSRIVVTLMTQNQVFYNLYLSPDGNDRNFAPLNYPKDLFTTRAMWVFGTNTVLGLVPAEGLVFPSADGQHQALITVEADRDHKATILSIATTSAGGSNRESLGSLTGLLFLIPPAWSPDSKKILLTEILEKGNLKFHLLSLDGKVRQREIVPEKPIYIPGVASQMESLIALGQQWVFWTPDSRRIIVLGNLDAPASDNFTFLPTLLVMDEDGKNINRFLNDPKQAVDNVSWSPDKKHLLFDIDKPINSAAAGPSAIAITKADGSDLKILTNWKTTYGYSNLPTWSPESSQIAFIGGAANADGVYIMDVDGNNQHQIFHFVPGLGIIGVFNTSWKLVATNFLDGLSKTVPTAATPPAIVPTAAPFTIAKSFMDALIAKEYTKAFALVHPSQQANFGGSPEKMQQLFADKGLQPTSFTPSNIQVGTDAIVTGTGTFEGAIKYVYIYLSKDGDTWKITGISVNDNPPTATPVS